MNAYIWWPEAPASEESLKQLAEQAGFRLTGSHLSQLRYSNGGEGDLSVDPGWISLWRAEDVISLNSAHGVPEFLPGLWGFGSNGGGELLTFDLGGGEPSPIVMVPFIPMELSEAVRIADSFDDFCRHIGRSAREPPNMALNPTGGRGRPPVG